MSSSEPGPRKHFFFFKRHFSVYVWGGQKDFSWGTPVDDLDCLYEFKYATRAWARLQLKGQHPAGVYWGCCTRIHDCVYFYDGLDESRKVTGSLYGLNLTTLTWQELSPPGPSSPSKKCGGGIVEHNHTLVIHGGDTEGGHTNETHIFDIATGTWSFPTVTGEVPKPDYGFVFCKFSQNKVIRCGGNGDKAIYILDLSKMHWTKVHQSGPDVGRFPTATCIAYGSNHAQLLMSGQNGMWLLNVATWELKELRNSDLLPDGEYLKRKGHGVTMLSSSSTSVEILIFGGETLHGFIISVTILLILKKNEDDKWWRIIDIIKGDKLKERGISYQYGPSYEDKVNTADVQHIDEVKVATDKSIKDDSHYNYGNSIIEEAGSDSTFSQTSQTSRSQSSQTSSQAAASKPIPYEDKEVKKHPEDQPEKVQFSSDVTAAIIKKQSIRRKIANLLLKGLPGSGKTSLLDRLLNQPLRAKCPSTGMCEKIVTVEISPSSSYISIYTDEDSTWKVTNFDKSIISQLDACKVFISCNTTKNSQQLLNHQEARTPKLDHSESDIKYHVNEVLRKHKINNIVDLQAKNSIYIRDTGGQVEFQESLSLLIFGPSIFIFVLRTDIDIHTKNIIQYRKPNGEIINKYKSSISTMDALIQFLTSVSAIKITEEGMFQEVDTPVCHKPIVFIVGTHIDQLGSKADSTLSNINKILHEMIFKRNYSGLIRYADFLLKKVMYEVDNTCSDDGQCQQLRSDINKFIQDRDEFFVVYPVSYLLFCLELQNIDETVLSMKNCEKLAAKFYIEKNEIPSLLNFLHFRVGIIQHYNVEGISDVVIKEPQVLFNKITDLILQTFLSSGSVSGEEHEIFMTKGILEASAFKDILSNEDKITSDQFLLFLIHLRIAVPFTDEDGIKKYIIPSVLNHVQKSSLDTINTDFAPLAITFKLGHCPQGLFGMLISYLLNPEETPELTFDLLENYIFQDQVSLRVNSSEETDQICISSHLSHLEVSVILNNYQTSSTSTASHALRQTSPYEICSKVRLTIENCLQLSLMKLHYNFHRVRPCFCLVCPDENCFQLHEVKKGKKSLYMHCSTHNSKLLLPKSGLCWFEEEISTSSTPSKDCSESSIVVTGMTCSAGVSSTIEGTTGHISSSTKTQSMSHSSTESAHVPEFNLKRLILLKWMDKDGQRQSLELRDDMSSRWYDIGVMLDLTSSRLDGIKMKHLGDVRQCCHDVLLDWIKNGSSDYPATWEGLLELLKDLKFQSHADSLQMALSSFQIH